MWVHDDDPLECGVKLTKPALIEDWKSGATLRELATKYGVSHDTAREWTLLLSRDKGASRRPKHRV